MTLEKAMEIVFKSPDSAGTELIYDGMQGLWMIRNSRYCTPDNPTHENWEKLVISTGEKILESLHE